MKSIMIINPIW